MIDASTAYRAAITADARRTLLRAVVDIISPDIVYGSVSGSAGSVYSRPAQLHDKVMELGAPCGTLEHNRWILDGTFDLAPPDAGTEVGYESDACFDAAGAGDMYVQMDFSGVSILQACSVYFPDTDFDGWPTDFTVTVYSGASAAYTESFTGNTARAVHLRGFTVADPTGIRVTVTGWSLPQRRLRIPEIVPGLYEQWGNAMLAEFSVAQQADFSALSLPYGTCHLQVDNTDGRFSPRSKSGLFQSLEERQGIEIYVGPAGAEYMPLGVFYQYSGGWKSSANGLTMNWELVDIVGLLANRKYVAPAALPTTLEGWVSSLVGQLGPNFAARYALASGVSGALELTATEEQIVGQTCGQILLWICQAAQCFARAAAATGYLTLSTLWDDGNTYTLDNLDAMPSLKANKDAAFFAFTLPDGTEISVAGTEPASSNTVAVTNPFIKTAAQAQAAAAWMIRFYGGNLIELSGRGDPSSEIGDAATVEFGPGDTERGRIQYQTYQIQGGVMQKCQTRLLQMEVIGT